jgi:hypothetical protein
MKTKYISILFLMIGLWSCKKGEAYTESASDTMAVMNVKLPVKPKTVVETSQKIIKNANLYFETTDLETTYSRIQTAINQAKATIQSDAENKIYGQIERTMVVRVPSQQFDAFINQISKGVNYFDTKESTSEDVTAQFVDLEARLKAKKALENRYLELLKKATIVSEMLEIEAKISEIREEIDAQIGRINYLQSQVSMSKVEIRFYKSIDTDTGANTSYFSKIWNSIKTGFHFISSGLLVIIKIWPLFLIAAIILFIIRRRTLKKEK